MSQIADGESDANTPLFTEPVHVSPKAVRRFYEVILLLSSLNEIYKNNASKKSDDLPQGAAEDSDENMFRNFVSRLSQICDSRPKGYTVTAFVVLQHPNNIEYVFGSNRRTEVELETTRGYINAILTSLRESSSCEDEDRHKECLRNILRDVLIFNRQRVQCYLNGLATALEQCISALGAEESSTDFDHVEALIEALTILHSPAMVMFLRRRANNEAARNTEPWRNFQHCSSRLLAYKRAVEVLWDAGCMWPELFENFEVTTVPSSGRAPNPLVSSPQKASEILSRIMSNSNSDESKRQYIEAVKDLQQNFSLDETIEDGWTSSTFRPIVHAEPLLLSWLEKTGGTRPDRFFNKWKCIGCSKPSCKLCYSYFTNHSSGVQIRGTHGNLYRNWSMPEYVVVSGIRTKDDAIKKRQDMMQNIMNHLKECVTRTLTDRTTEGRRLDSNTLSTGARNNALAELGQRTVPRTWLSTSSEVDLNEDLATVDSEGDSRDGGTSLEVGSRKPPVQSPWRHLNRE